MSNNTPIQVRDERAARDLIDLMVGHDTVGADSYGNELGGPPISPRVQAHLRAALGDACPFTGYGTTNRDGVKAVAIYLRSVGDVLDPGPAEQPVILIPAMEAVLEERRRQDQRYGGPGHDDRHADGSLVIAATVYALDAAQGYSPHHAAIEQAADALRPHSPCGHRIDDDARRRLVKGAACLLAEIERLDRAAGNGA